MSNGKVAVAPMQWAELKKLKDVEPINDSDLDCMAEVSEVLKKHGKRERFGVALLHEHFDMNADELLVEDSDDRVRVLTSKPLSKEAAEGTVPTVWMLLDNENRVVQSCKTSDCFTGF